MQKSCNSAQGSSFFHCIKEKIPIFIPRLGLFFQDEVNIGTLIRRQDQFVRRLYKIIYYTFAYAPSDFFLPKKLKTIARSAKVVSFYTSIFDQIQNKLYKYFFVENLLFIFKDGLGYENLKVFDLYPAVTFVDQSVTPFDILEDERYLGNKLIEINQFGPNYRIYFFESNSGIFGFTLGIDEILGFEIFAKVSRTKIIEFIDLVFFILRITDKLALERGCLIEALSGSKVFVKLDPFSSALLNGRVRKFLKLTRLVSYEEELIKEIGCDKFTFYLIQSDKFGKF